MQAVKLEQQMLKVLCKDSTSVYRVDLMNDRAEIVKIEEHSNSAGDLLPHGQELFSYAEAVELTITSASLRRAHRTSCNFWTQKI